MKRFALAAALVAVAAVVISSVAIASHQDGHSQASGTVVKQVEVVRHSFPVSEFPGGQWVTTADAFVTVPGATTTINVPQGEHALIVVRFSPSVICQGSGTCEAQVLIGETPGKPDKPVYFDSENHWGSMYVERSLRVGPGRYTVKGQVLTTYGLSGTTLYVRSFHLTVERFAA